jgi:hypothetical protein
MKEICKCCGQEIPNKDDISYSQHKLYRSFLLPALTEALGESNNQYCHEFILKPEFIYRQTGEYYYKVEKFDDIPVKHQNSARILSGYIYAESPVVKECIIYGYVPSMAAFTKKETKEYFIYCETMLEEIGGQIPTDSNQEYKQLRERVLK